VRFLQELTAKNVEVRRVDITSDEVEPDAFDLAHCRALLVHMRDPAAVLRRMTQALRPGGLLLAEEPYFEPIAAADDKHPLAPAFNTTFPLRFKFLRDAGLWILSSDEHFLRRWSRWGSLTSKMMALRISLAAGTRLRATG
jgi:SAM-dependent methyltransferase